jgi:SAM-dependent methyltransferase
MRPVTNWIENKDIDTIYSSNYWNNIEEEKNKEFWIVDGKYERCLAYLQETGLLGGLQESLEYSGIKKGKNYRVADIAAGICWTSAEISKLDSVAEIHSLDLSRHRIELLAPHAFKMLHGVEEKAYRYVGSFYDIHLDTTAYDFIFMSTVFHHADYPMHLLIECDKILKKGGAIVLLGEVPVGYIDILKMQLVVCMKALLKFKKPKLDFFNLFPPDNVLGDHYYKLDHYKWIFRFMGYDVSIFNSCYNGTKIFIATKK